MFLFGIIIGNVFGEDGIDELKSVLERQSQLDILGSLSDDEEEDEDEEEEDDDDEENVTARDDNEGELSEDLALQIQGIALQSDSPLLHNDDTTTQVCDLSAL